MSWKDIGKPILKKILVGIVSIASLKAFMNVMEGKDILGRPTDPEKVERQRIIELDDSDYTIV